MDVLKNISGSEDKDIIVSLPKNKTWLEYLAYFLELKYKNLYFEVIIQTVPRTAPGKRCYLVFDGFVRGWMEIHKLKETENQDICISLVPMLTSSVYKTPMNDIDDYKYYFDNSSMQ